MKSHYGYTLTAEELACTNRLSVSFCPEDVTFQWSQCGTLSNLIAQYVACWRLGTQDLADEVTSTISYCINELLENAIKFREGGSIDAIAYLLPSNALLFLVNNTSSQTQAQELIKMITDFVKTPDPNMLLLHTMEGHAQTPGQSESTLGLLSLMCDYKAQLGWDFNPVENAMVRITTTAKIQL